MYIMCVCLFSALSRWVGALQISIISIILLLLLPGGLGLCLCFEISRIENETYSKTEASFEIKIAL